VSVVDIPPDSSTSKSFVFIVEKDGPADQTSEIRFDGGSPSDTSPRLLDGGTP
jgi:hypothetical protein